eukprot:3143047-Prymnesium_polylepis.1
MPWHPVCACAALAATRGVPSAAGDFAATSAAAQHFARERHRAAAAGLRALSAAPRACVRGGGRVSEAVWRLERR